MTRSSKTKKHIVFGAGGTAGHVMPAIAMATDLSPEYKITFITDARGAKFVLGTKHECLFHDVIVLDIKNTRNWKNFLSVTKNTFRLIWFFAKNNVKITISFGSYVSFVVAFASALTMKKNIIHEQNKILGLANTISLLFFSRLCMAAFPNTKTKYKFLNKKMLYVGMPVRKDIDALLKNEEERRIKFSIHSINRNFHLTIVGGSLGSKIITDIATRAISCLDSELKSLLVVHHQTTQDTVEYASAQYRALGIKANVSHFFENIGEIMSESHLIISRSGASIIFESIHACVPMILIPMATSANNHQFANAKYILEHGGCNLMAETEAKPEKIAMMISFLILNPINLYDMSKRMLELAKLNQNTKIRFRAIVEGLS